MAIDTNSQQIRASKLICYLSKSLQIQNKRLMYYLIHVKIYLVHLISIDDIKFRG